MSDEATQKESENGRPEGLVRVGVLGTGAISQVVHLPILAERTDVEVVALADRDLHKAETLAERFEVRRIHDAEGLFGDPEVDAVVICTPNHLHEEHAIAALEAGKHVLVERPMALDPEGASRIIEAADASGRAIVVGNAHRFRPDVAALRAFIQGGELGEVYHVRGAWLNRKSPTVRPSWRHDADTSGGGALIDLGVAGLDLILWLVGYPEIARVSASMTVGEFEVEDSATVFFETPGGMAFTLEVSWNHFAAEDTHYARALGSEGSGSLPPLSVFKQLGGRPLDVTPRQPTPRGGENPYTNSYRRELDHFVRVVAGEADAPLPREQIRLLELIRAAYRSAEERTEVRL